ncbi:hypothetical protein Dimus_003765, partial [Dionaea muscipula]
HTRIMKKPITNSTAAACVRHQPITLQSSFLRHFEEPKHPPTCSSINGPSSYQPISKVSPSMQSSYDRPRPTMKISGAGSNVKLAAASTTRQHLDTSAQPMKPAQPNFTSM